MDPHQIIKMQEFNRPTPCNVSAIEDVISNQVHSEFRVLAEQTIYRCQLANVLI